MLQPLQRKIDCVVRVVTPENIEFEYLVAGPFQRIPAFLIDMAVRTSIFVFVIIAFSFLGIPLGSSTMTLVFTVGILSFFLLSWVYGTYMETRFNGRTIGKMALKLRVISADGRPINGTQAALRNMLRLCDFMPPLTLTLLIPDAPAANAIPTCLIGLVAMTLTERMQRVGDLAAGTMVVWEGRKGYNTNLQPEDPRAYALSELIPPTFQVSRTLAKAVALYMERRIHLSAQRREEIARNLAQPLLEMFQLRADTSADLLLCAIYVRIYHSEDQRIAKIQAARRSGQLGNDQAARVGYQQPAPMSLNSRSQSSQPIPSGALPAQPTGSQPLAPRQPATESTVLSSASPPASLLVNPYDEPPIMVAEILPDMVPAQPVLPAQSVPAQSVPAQSLLAQSLPAQSVPPREGREPGSSAS